VAVQEHGSDHIAGAEAVVCLTYKQGVQRISAHPGITTRSGGLDSLASTENAIVKCAAIIAGEDIRYTLHSSICHFYGCFLNVV
jgi:hypothetical protein